MSARVTQTEVAAKTAKLRSAGDERVETGRRRRCVASRCWLAELLVEWLLTLSLC